MIVMVTLQVPALIVFTPVPNTLHTFAYVDAIFSAYLPPDGTVAFASFSRVVFDAVDPYLNTFDTVDDAPVLVPAGAAVVGVVGAGGASVVLDAGATDDELDDEEELEEDELDEFTAAARVTLKVYVWVIVPSMDRTANEIDSVAPAATLRVSVSLESANVPVEFVRLIAAPDDDAITVKVTDADAFGMFTL